MKHRDKSAFRLDIWPGFTDAVSSMLLVLVFVLIIFVIAEVGLLNLLGGKDSLIQEMELQVRDLQALLSSQQNRGDRLETELRGLRTRLPQLELDREEAEAALIATKEKLDATDARVADLMESLQAYVARLEDLKKSYDTTAEELALEQESVKKLESLAKELRIDRSKQAKKLEEIERQLAQKGLRISNLLIELERRERELAELRRVDKYRSEFFGRLVDVFKDDPNIKVVGDRFVFQSEVLFPSGSADVQAEGQAQLKKFVETWKSLQDRIPRSVPINIQIQGHTDTRPVVGTTYASNWELSTARATEVVRLLIEEGIPADMLSAAGFSKYYPANTGTSEAAFRQNRRIEIRITAR